MPAHKKSDLTARIVEMRKTMTMAQVAKELGKSVAAVNYHCMIHRGTLRRASPKKYVCAIVNVDNDHEQA